MMTLKKADKNVRPKIPKTLRALVWNTYIGEDKGTFICMCGSKFSQLNFECGHIVSLADGGKTNIDNLRPICSMCNKSMGKTNYYEFVKCIYQKATIFTWPRVNEDVDISDFVMIDSSEARVASQEKSKIFSMLPKGVDILQVAVRILVPNIGKVITVVGFVFKHYMRF